MTTNERDKKASEFFVNLRWLGLLCAGHSSESARLHEHIVENLKLSYELLSDCVNNNRNCELYFRVFRATNQELLANKFKELVNDPASYHEIQKTQVEFLEKIATLTARNQAFMKKYTNFLQRQK